MPGSHTATTNGVQGETRANDGSLSQGMGAGRLAAGGNPNYATLDVSIGRDWPITGINKFHRRPRSSLRLQLPADRPQPHRDPHRSRGPHGGACDPARWISGPTHFTVFPPGA